MHSNRYRLAATAVAAASVVQAGSLKDIKHIVLFMQENRSFDHYFGTMAGVRGFGDPNAQVNPDGQSVFQQSISPAMNGSNILKPWHINYLGGDWVNATQCMGAGDNGWDAMHDAYNGGLGNKWFDAEGGYSLGYFNRDDVPTHFDIAEGWTVLDMNSQGILAATDPNRIMWMSGSVNIPGNPTNPDGKGGIIIDNSATPGCEAPGLNCFPFVWKTFPEYLQEAGVSWQVWQDLDNFEDNMLAYFEQYQKAANGSALREKGNSYPGLDKFYAHAAAGTLPQVSWIIGPQELAEHPPNMPKDGAWFQKKVVDAITSSPAYNETVLVISYDEQGGWYDHVVPEVSEPGTLGEWFKDPYHGKGDVPLGPGPRIPRYIISPWTRGGNVFTEHADHNSDMMFVEKWAAANGYDSVHNKGITQWRRDHMSDLVNAFDFENPDYSIPSIADGPAALTEPDDPSDYSGNLELGSLTGPWVGPAHCLSDYPSPHPPIPYGPDNANQDLSLLVEEGFKRVRGKLTEGRYLTLEIGGLALTNVANRFVGVSPATKRHDNIHHRWVLHAVPGQGSNSFYIQSAVNKAYIAGSPVPGTLTKDMKKAQAFTISYTAYGSTYSLGSGHKKGSFVDVKAEHGRSAGSGASAIAWQGLGAGSFKIFSVSYH